MSSKSNPQELWSSSLVEQNELEEARTIKQREAESSMFRFLLIILFLASLIFSRSFLA